MQLSLYIHISSSSTYSSSTNPSRTSSRLAGKNNTATSGINVASTSHAAMVFNANANSLGFNLLPTTTTTNVLPNISISNNTNKSNLSQSSAHGANTTMVGTGIRPLMSTMTPFATGQNTSAPDASASITRPPYSSLTSHNVMNNSLVNPPMPASNNNLNLKAPFNTNDSPSLKEFISASVRIAQSEALQTMENRLALMIPQLVRNSIDSLRNVTGHHI